MEARRSVSGSRVGADLRRDLGVARLLLLGGQAQVAGPVGDEGGLGHQRVVSDES
jgi:hypothetical protein